MVWGLKVLWCCGVWWACALRVLWWVCFVVFVGFSGVGFESFEGFVGFGGVGFVGFGGVGFKGFVFGDMGFGVVLVFVGVVRGDLVKHRLARVCEVDS